MVYAINQQTLFTENKKGILWHYACLRFLLQTCIVFEVVFLNPPRVCSIRCTKLAPGWVLIRVNFDPIQDFGPKVGFQHSLVVQHPVVQVLRTQ